MCLALTWARALRFSSPTCVKKQTVFGSLLHNVIMSAKNKTSTTTVGYFNSNDFPMQLLVSEHNLTINLKPKEWIFDRSTPPRLVTDPILDGYVGKGKLSRASNPAKEAPIVCLTSVNAPPTPGQPAPVYTHAVTTAKSFVKDPATGQVRPVMAAPSTPVPTTAPPVSYNPVKGFSMAEARRLKLIRPTKAIAEDFGATETASGAPRPGEQIPTIEYATDTTRPQPGSEVVAAPITADQHGVMEAMTKGVATVSPDAEDVVAATIAAVRNNPQSAVAVQQPPPLPAVSEAAARLLNPQKASAIPPIPTNPTPTEIIAEGPDPAAMIVEEEIAGAVAPAPVAPVAAKKKAAALVPVPPVNEAAVAVTTAAPVAERRFQCPKCGTKPFNAPKYFKRHVNQYHPDEAAALVAQVLG